MGEESAARMEEAMAPVPSQSPVWRPGGGGGRGGGEGVSKPPVDPERVTGRVMTKEEVLRREPSVMVRGTLPAPRLKSPEARVAPAKRKVPPVWLPTALRVRVPAPTLVRDWVPVGA